MLITIIGRRGTGKTTLAKTLLLNYNNIFIFDYLGEYFSISKLKNKKVYIETENSYKLFKSSWEKSKKELKNLLVCDEVDLYGKYNPHLEFLYRYGRHVNLDIIAVARRVYDIPIYIRDLTNVFYFFQITEVRGLEYIKKFFSENVANKISKLPPLHYVKLEI